MKARQHTVMMGTTRDEVWCYLSTVREYRAACLRRAGLAPAAVARELGCSMSEVAHVHPLP